MSKRTSSALRGSRADGRKSLLLYLPKELIRTLKITAINEGRHAYEIMEQALKEYLGGRRRAQKKTKGL